MTGLTGTCAHWCADHDDETGQCHSGYRHVDLSLEHPVTRFGETRPAQLNTALETLVLEDGDQPVIVVFPNTPGASGFTLTRAEARRVAVQLLVLADTAATRGVA